MLLSELLTECLCGSRKRNNFIALTDDEKKQASPTTSISESAYYASNRVLLYNDTRPEVLARRAIDALVAGDDSLLKSLNHRLSDKEVNVTSWAASIAQAILDRLVEAVKPGNPIGNALRDPYNIARAAALQAFQFIQDHPEVLGIVIALGILCLIAPWVVHVLGFAEEGVVAGEFTLQTPHKRRGWYYTVSNINGLTGSWAARWQSTFGGIIEEGSLFAWLQSFGALH